MREEYHMKKRLLALTLCAAMAGSLLTLPAAADTAPASTKAHLPVDYADMVYTGFDDDALQALFTRLIDLETIGALEAEDPTTRQEVEAIYASILREYDVILTQYYLIDLRYDADVTDAWAATESADFGQRFDRVTDQCYSAFALLADTPYADVMAATAGWGEVSSLADYEPMTDEEAELYAREEELVQAYERAMAQPFTADYRGRSWTADELYDDASISTKTYWQLLTEIEKQENAAVGPIFLELVQVRDQIARLSGYDNYVDYAYESVYTRDYTPEDMEGVYKQVKEELVPLYERITDLAGDDLYALEDLPTLNAEDLLAHLQPYMDDLDSDLGAAFSYLREYHLYDLDSSPTKNATGYTVPLPAYGSAFIFDAPYGDYRDWTTVIHEFGHFFETYNATQSDLWADFSIDVGEVHSQGLEVLFTAYAGDLFGKSLGRGFTWNTLLNMVDSVLEGCMYDEFQAEIYRNPHMTLDEMNALFLDLSLAYGYADRGDDRAYFWVEVPHTFQQPMYYVSYATSALSALDLYRKAQTDRPAAVDTWLDLCYLSMTLPYREAMEEVGLQDIFSGDTVTQLAQFLDDHLSDTYSTRPAARPMREKEQPAIAPKTVLLLTALVLAAATGVALTVLLVVLLRRSRKKSRDPWDEEMAAVSCSHGGHKDPWEDDDTLPACKDHKTHKEPWKK